MLTGCPRSQLGGCTIVMDRVGSKAVAEWQRVNDGARAQAIPIMNGPPSEET